MKRREFMSLLGGAAAAWPLTVRAQQPERMRRIGVLMSVAAHDPLGQSRFAAFLQGLQEFSWAVGRNVEDRHSLKRKDNADDIRKYAAELVALAPDVILASGGSGEWDRCYRRPAPCRSLFTQTPDPSRRRLCREPGPAGRQCYPIAQSIANSAKWLELLKEIAPLGDASGGPSRSGNTRRDRRVRRDPVRCAVVRGGGEPGRHS